MLDYLHQLLESGSLSPHGICLLWRPELIWTHAVSDALIGVAYLSIPLALGYFVSKREDVAFGWVFWCFVTFILACGATHFLSIWTLWSPDYGLEALVKAFTAAASVATAVALWPLLPKALALPSPGQLRVANEALTTRIAERDRAMAALERSNAERDRVEDMLRQSQKMEAIGQLTGGVAHDFNNMLNIVLANLERVERHLEPDSKLIVSVRDAMTGAERAAAVTQKLLAFARKQPLNPVEIQPSALVDDLIDLVRGPLGSGVLLRTDLGPHPWSVRADGHQLENAVLNLVFNARDALVGGEGAVTITARNVGASETGRSRGLDPGCDYVMIEVADTGVGMARDVCERAFEPFFTTKPLGQGTGLGLSQVFGFAKQSGGHVEIESEPGRGTKVRLFLPRAQPGPSPSPSGSPDATGPSAALDAAMVAS